MAISWKFIDSEIGSLPIDNIDSGYGITDVSGSETKYPSIEVGTIRKAIDTGSDGDGIGEFIYLKGVASTVAGDWVVYDEECVTSRLAAATTGNVAVAMAATVADKWGWYQITGNAQAKRETGSAVDAALYSAGVTGSSDDAAADGRAIEGAINRVGNATGAQTTATVQLNRPYHDAAGSETPA